MRTCQPGIFRLINGKLIDSAIIGVLCFILCLIFRIPYPMLVSVVVGVTNIIPFFGPIIGAIPCLMILVIVDLGRPAVLCLGHRPSAV